MSEPKKFPCPVCGQIIQEQGRAGHNRSKFHLAALEKPPQEVPEPKLISEPKTKPVESIAPPEIKSGLGDTAHKKSGGFLDWITEEDDDF